MAAASCYRERGSSTIEFVIGIATMVVLLMMVIQVAVYFHLRAVAGTAARHGVDRGRVTDGTEADAEFAAHEFLDQAGDSLLLRRVDASRTGTRVTVTVTGRVPSVVPGLAIDLNVTKFAEPERFVE